MSTSTKETKAEKTAEDARCLKQLQEWLKPEGEGPREVYAKVTKVSASGMCRRIQLFIAYLDKGTPKILNITYYAHRVIGWSMNDEGIKVTGCGMDMRWHLVEVLASAVGGGYSTRLDLDCRAL